MTEIEERLHALLAMVNDWLKYAEAKNAGVIAVSGLAASAVVSYGASIEHPTQWDIWSLGTACVAFILGVSVGMLSFVPKLDPLNISSGVNEKPEPSDSLYYFGHLARLRSEQLVQKLLDRHGDHLQLTPDRAGELDLAGQVIINSRITGYKLSRFRAGSALILLGLVISLVSIIGSAIT